MPRMPQRPRSHSYSAPVSQSHPGQNTQLSIPPFHPINSVISDEHRAAHNLRVLQRHDDKICVIHDQIPWVIVKLMKPPGSEIKADEENEFWEEEVDGSEGPLFFVERDVPDPDAKLGFCVLNAKDIFSWVQVLHRDDEIEFSTDMAIIVPSGRKDVMWPAVRTNSCDGIYSAYVTRLLARCHLLLKYNLEWPSRWSGGHGKLPDNSVPDPQSASHNPGVNPLKENDLLKMLMVGSHVTEIERVAEEIVRVVSAGGTWCRNEFAAPEGGWPPGFDPSDLKGTTLDVWGPVVSNPRPEETTTSRATLTKPEKPDANITSNPDTFAEEKVIITGSNNAEIKSSTEFGPIITDTTVKQPPNPKKEQQAGVGKKKGKEGSHTGSHTPTPSHTPSTHIPLPSNNNPNGVSGGGGKGKVLNSDVLSHLLVAPIKSVAPTPGATNGVDEHKTPVPSDFITLPAEDIPPVPSLPTTNGIGKGKKKQKGKKGNAGSKAEPVQGDHLSIPSNPNLQTPSLSPVSYSWVRPSFGIIDDRLSDEEDETTDASTRSSPEVSRAPSVNGLTLLENLSSASLTSDQGAFVQKSDRSSPVNNKGEEKRREKDGAEKPISQEDLERLTASLGLPPPFVKYHKKGYIPSNSAVDPPSLDAAVVHDVLVDAVGKQGEKFQLLERGDWVRELLQLIHTNRTFVDGIYGEYKARLESSSSR